MVDVNYNLGGFLMSVAGFGQSYGRNLFELITQVLLIFVTIWATNYYRNKRDAKLKFNKSKMASQLFVISTELNIKRLWDILVDRGKYPNAIELLESFNPVVPSDFLVEFNSAFSDMELVDQLELTKITARHKNWSLDLQRSVGGDSNIYAAIILSGIGYDLLRFRDGIIKKYGLTINVEFDSSYYKDFFNQITMEGWA